MVAASHPPLHLIGDEDSSKRRQILDGAKKVFMDLGFDGASMGEIARSAGVSKGTLYVYFADKNRLFEAIVEEEMLDQQKVAFNFEPERDVATTLREFSEDMRSKRMLLAEKKANELPVKMVIPLALGIFPVILMIVLLPVILKLLRLIGS